MSESYLGRLVRSVEEHDGGVFVTLDDGRLSLAEYRGERFDPPLLLDFTEGEFQDAVQEVGENGGTSLWPELPPAEGGFRLSLVHLQESLHGVRAPSTRLYLAQSQLHAE